jgi:Bacterial extracellular solute-binding protein
VRAINGRGAARREGTEGIVSKWSINVLLGSILVLASASAVQAAELQVIAGGGIAGSLNEIATLFERASGHKLVIRYGTTPELIKMATSGVAFDLGVVPQDVWKDAAARAQIAPGPTLDVARVGLGVAVRSGAPRHQHGGGAQADAAQGAVHRLDTSKRHRHSACWHIRAARHHRRDEGQDQGAARAQADR